MIVILEQSQNFFKVIFKLALSSKLTFYLSFLSLKKKRQVLDRLFTKVPDSLFKVQNTQLLPKQQWNIFLLLSPSPI